MHTTQPPQLQQAKQRFSKLRQALCRDRLLPPLAVGLTSGTASVLFDLALAALIFSGSLADHLATGIGLVLVSAAAARVATALLGSVPGVVAGLGTVPTAILAWSAGAIAETLPASASASDRLFTVLVAIALTSLLTGGFLLMLGALRVGEWVRSVPAPAVGGVVASTGWFLITGGFSLMTGYPLALEQVPHLLQADIVVHWVPGVLFALYLLIVSQRRAHPWMLPVSLFGAIGLFYLLFWLAGSPVAAASTPGWTLAVSPIEVHWPPFAPLNLSAQVHWSAIALQFPCLITVIVVTAISLLLNLTGLELVTDRPIDVNRELKVAGVANLAIGLGGGILSYPSLSKSMLVHQMGARGRLATLVEAAVLVTVLLVGFPLLTNFPRPILGGLLLFLGMSLLIEWLYNAWFKLSKANYLIVLLIAITGSTIGFWQGLILGWGIAVVVFVLAVDPVQRVHSGSSGASSSGAKRDFNRRTPHERRILQECGDQIYGLELQGLLFFGSVGRLLNQIRQRITDRQLPPLRYIVLDFHRVSGLDAAAVHRFWRLSRLAERHQFTLVLTQLSPPLQAKLEQGDCLTDRVRIRPSFACGLSWCEDQILAAAKPVADLPQMAALLSQQEQGTLLISYLSTLQLAQGDYLFRPGDPAHHLYFVVYGQLSLVLDPPDGPPEQRQGFGDRDLIGAKEFYWGLPRSAGLVANQPSCLYCLSRDALGRMEQESPLLAREVHQLITPLLTPSLESRNCRQ